MWQMMPDEGPKFSTLVSTHPVNADNEIIDGMPLVVFN